MGELTLREALASDRLDAWVQEQQDDGAELTTGSELERGLALLNYSTSFTRRRRTVNRTQRLLSRRERGPGHTVKRYHRPPHCVRFTYVDAWSLLERSGRLIVSA